MQSQRQRSRKACQPCRNRKRKCDGCHPCGTCVRYAYDCYFSASKRSVANAQHETLFDPASPISTSITIDRIYQQPAVLDPIKTRYMKANSGVAFPRLLGIELNSSNAPRLHSFAWNLGVRPEPEYQNPDLAKYISVDLFEPLAQVFFSIVDPIFHFVNKNVFIERYQQRFSPHSKDTQLDPVIYGVAALGSFFSATTNASAANEAEFIQLAKEDLERTSVLSSPTYDHVAAWILRTIYLRHTTRPHASWLSSCTTMHLIEATGLHQEVSQIAIVSPPAPDSSETELDLRRRLFWTAKSLNEMISHEYGRSPVRFSGISVQRLSVRDDDRCLRDQYIALADILPGEKLNTHDREVQESLHDALLALTKLVSDSDEIKLFRADLAFSIYRRMRVKQKSGHGIPVEALSLIIDLGVQALPSSSALAAKHLPWYTVISVPFQFVCVLLAIDSRDSLSYMGKAMAALEEVGRHWDTHMIREAIGSAGLLVKLSQKRKEEDMKWLEMGMPKNSGPHGHLPSVMADTAEVGPEGQIGHQAGILNGGTFVSTSQMSGLAMPNTFDFIEGMDIPMPEDSSIDWNDFFSNMEWL